MSIRSMYSILLYWKCNLVTEVCPQTICRKGSSEGPARPMTSMAILHALVMRSRRNCGPIRHSGPRRIKKKTRTGTVTTVALFYPFRETLYDTNESTRTSMGEDAKNDFRRLEELLGTTVDREMRHMLIDAHVTKWHVANRLEFLAQLQSAGAYTPGDLDQIEFRRSIAESRREGGTCDREGGAPPRPPNRPARR